MLKALIAYCGGAQSCEDARSPSNCGNSSKIYDFTNKGITFHMQVFVYGNNVFLFNTVSLNVFIGTSKIITKQYLFSQFNTHYHLTTFCLLK